MKVMNIAVWDKYVAREDGLLMHFDIMVPDDLQNTNQIYEYADQYLGQKDFKVENVRTSRCQFCHIEQATAETIAAVADKGFDIIEFENCH